LNSGIDPGVTAARIILVVVIYGIRFFRGRAFINLGNSDESCAGAGAQYYYCTKVTFFFLSHCQRIKGLYSARDNTGEKAKACVCTPIRRRRRVEESVDRLWERSRCRERNGSAWIFVLVRCFVVSFSYPLTRRKGEKYSRRTKEPVAVRRDNVRAGENH